MTASEMKDSSADDADADIAYETRLPVNAGAAPENQRKISPLGVAEGVEGKTSMVHVLPTTTMNCSPSSGAIERIQKMRNEDQASPMMMEFLRSRLLSERGVSRTAREHVEQLSSQIQELECQLELEVQLRKKAEATKLEVFSKYKEFFTDESYDLVALNPKEEAGNGMITACEEDEDSRSLDINNSLNIEGEDAQSSLQSTSIECSIVSHTEKQEEESKHDMEPALQKGVLMWETQRKNRDKDKKQALDRSSHGLSPGRALVHKMPATRSVEGEALQKKWKGKSVRQIKKRDSRLLAEEESNTAEDSGGLSGSDSKEGNQQLDPNGEADLNNFLETQRTQDSPECQDRKHLDSFDESTIGELGQISTLPDVNGSSLCKAGPVHEMQENNELSKIDGMQNDSNSQNDLCSNNNFTLGGSERSLLCLDSLNPCDLSDLSGRETPPLGITTQRDVAIDQGVEENLTEKSKQPELVSNTAQHARSHSISHTEEHSSQTRLTKMSPPSRHVSSKSLDTGIPWEDANRERGMDSGDIKDICEEIPKHAGFDWDSQQNDDWDREINGVPGQPSFPLGSAQCRNLSRSANRRTLGLERVGEVLEALALVKEQVQGFPKSTDTWASMGTRLPRIGRPFGGPLTYTNPSRAYANRQVGPNIISSVGMELSLTSPKYENS